MAFRSRSSQFAAAERAPRLVGRFVVLAGLGLTVAAAILMTLAEHSYARHSEQAAIGRAQLLSRLALDPHLRRDDLEPPVTAAERRRLARLFRSAAHHDGVSAVWLFDGRADVVVARGVRVGEDERAYVRRALSGTAIAHVGGSASGRQLSTYLPVAQSGRILGVIVVRQPYAPIAAAARRSALIAAAVLEGVLLILLVLLVPPLSRASRRIAGHLAELDWHSTHDELTGLANRIGFQRVLERALAQHTSASVLVVDLDRFHEINDTLGPSWGDALLRQSSHRLAGMDELLVAARLGEDEFGLILPYADERVLDRLTDVEQLMTEPITFGDECVSVGARIGVAQFPDHGGTPETLIRRAGVALSIAKSTGHDVEMYDPEHDASDISRISLATELRLALQDDQLVVHYQPQADLATGAIRGVEALVRWQHPERGLLAASSFVDVAEQAGLIGQIGRFVIREAAEQWAVWNREGIRMDLAVNLSAVDLLDPNLAGEILEIITKAEMPPEYLVLEITERSILGVESDLDDLLVDLQRVGARLAVDDYGTGYSSLASMRNLHAQQVKLDRTFIEDLPGNPTNATIVRSTIDLAHTLGATVVAEGVETQAQWDYLAGAGCDIAQGYFIGAALSPAELRPMLIGPPSLRIVAA